jgi:hypothetical protein
MCNKASPYTKGIIKGGHLRIETYRISTLLLPPFQAEFGGRRFNQELATY